MKFVVEYQIRNAGLTYEQSIANSTALLTAFSKWKPEEGLKIDAFLAKVEGSGGYVNLEANDAKVVQSFVAKFTFWNDVKVIPVVDIADGIGNAQAAIAWASMAAKS